MSSTHTKRQLFTATSISYLGQCSDFISAIAFMNGSQQINQVENVLEFIQKIMQTLSTVSKAIRYRYDSGGNVINLSQYSFTKNRCTVK